MLGTCEGFDEGSQLGIEAGSQEKVVLVSFNTPFLLNELLISISFTFREYDPQVELSALHHPSPQESVKMN